MRYDKNDRSHVIENAVYFELPRSKRTGIIWIITFVKLRKSGVLLWNRRE